MQANYEAHQVWMWWAEQNAGMTVRLQRHDACYVVLDMQGVELTCIQTRSMFTLLSGMPWCGLEHLRSGRHCKCILVVAKRTPWLLRWVFCPVLSVHVAARKHCIQTRTAMINSRQPLPWGRPLREQAAGDCTPNMLKQECTGPIESTARSEHAQPN